MADNIRKQPWLILLMSEIAEDILLQPDKQGEDKVQPEQTIWDVLRNIDDAEDDTDPDPCMVRIGKDWYDVITVELSDLGKDTTRTQVLHAAYQLPDVQDGYEPHDIYWDSEEWAWFVNLYKPILSIKQNDQKEKEG